MVDHRLKILILLDDVYENGRCTSYTVGTHKVRWKNYDYDQSRYDEDIIEKNLKLVNFMEKKVIFFYLILTDFIKEMKNQTKRKEQ